MKKLLTLAVMLCVFLQVWADTWTDSNGIVWSFTVSEGKAIDVKPYNKSSIPVNLVIPGKMNSYPVISVGDHAFSNCEELISISIPSSVTIIKNDAFFNCPKMESITLTRGLKTIEQRAFSTHSNYLKDIDVPEGVTSIGNNAFADNPALESVNLPSSLSSLGGYVFYQCNNLRMVNANSSTPLYIYQTLYPYSATLYVPVGSKAAYKSANYWKEFVNVQEVGYTGKTDSELTGETDISCFYVNRPGLLGNFFVQAGRPEKVKIIGEVDANDLRSLFYDDYYNTYYTNYIDLSEAHINGCKYNGGNYPDNYLDSSWMGGYSDESWYGPRTLVLPMTLQELKGGADQLYSEQTTPFKTTIYSGKFYVPSGTRNKWIEQTTYPENVLIMDGPSKNVNVSTAGQLWSKLNSNEIETLNELTISGYINAKDFNTLKRMKNLVLLKINATWEAYEGNDGPVKDQTFYRAAEIPAYVFQNHSNLEIVSLRISSGMEGFLIGDYAFDGCTKLKTFECEGVSSLGDFCFRNTKVMDIRLIGTKYDVYWESTYGETNTKYCREFEHIGLQPFFGVESTSSPWRYASFSSEWEDPASDSYDDNYYYLYNLKNFTVIPSYWELYDSYFGRPYFSGVTNKAETLLYAMTTIKDYDLTLPASITTLADYAVSGLQIRSINLNSVTAKGDGFLYKCPLLKSITCDNTAYKSIDGVLYTADLKTLVKYPCASTAESLTIPATINQISKWAFEGSQNLKTITIETTTPPTLAGQAFDDFDVADITLYVPAGSKAAYKAAAYWKEFKEIVEMPAPESGIAESMVLPWGTEQAWEMKYMYLDQIGNEPAVDGAGRSWTNVGYDDSSWGTLTGPIASNSTYFTSVNTIWEKEGGCYYLRRTFELDKVNEGGYTFLSKHDDKLQVWINGSQVISADYNGNLQSYHIPATAFVNGTNTLAILVEDYGGDANLDYSLCNLFYLKNVETGKYLNRGNCWGTHAVLSDEPLPASISKQADGSYTIYFPIGSNYQQMLYRANEEDVYVDYNKDFDGAYPYWTITEAGNGNYHIQTLTTHETYGQTAMPGTYLGNNPNKEAHDAGGGALGRYNDVDGNVSSTGNITWQLVPDGLHTAAQAERLRELITQANSLYDINTHIAQKVLENEQAGYTEMMLQILQLEGWINDCIGFEDEAVKTLCVAKWDTNHDGELSRAEAGAVTDLGKVFKGNTDITSFSELRYFTGVTTISPETFMGSSLESIVFPSTLTAIGYDAFRDCANLKSIDFNGCSAYVENQCFMGCSSLEEVYIPNSIQFRNSDLSWSWNTFGWCTSLKKVVFEAFGEEQTEYPARWSTTTMFNDCASLETVVLPSLSVVEHQFFLNCKNLKTVTILEVEDDFDTHLHNFDKKFGDSKAGQIQFIVPDGTAEKMLQAGYLYISDLGGLPLIRQEFEEEAARITTMANALTDGDKEALSAAISEARTTINAAEDYATAYAQIAAVKTAAKTFLTTANYALGFDVTAAYINNPDFSKLQIGWSTPGDYVVWPDKNHRGYQGNIYENGDILIRDFIESWEDGYALQDGALSQVITNLPAGVYRLECDAIATWQGDDAVEVTGVSLFAGDSQTAVATANERPQHFSVEFTNLTTADVEIGIRANETNANWMAADNFRLYHIDAVGDVSQFDDAIYIEPVSARIGGNVEVAICLKNAQSASAYKFDLVLPEGVTIAKDGNGRYIDVLSDRHSDHTRTLNYKEADKVYSFATLSGNSEALTGNDGAIRLVTLHVADDVAEGTYPIEIKNASYSLTDGKLHTVVNTTTSITVENYILGDVNGNSMVDIGDAVSIVNYLVGKPSATFIEKAADTNKNGQTDIGDAVTIVNFLVGKTASLSRSIGTTMDEKEPQ